MFERKLFVKLTQSLRCWVHLEQGITLNFSDDNDNDQITIALAHDNDQTDMITIK